MKIFVFLFTLLSFAYSESCVVTLDGVDYTGEILCANNVSCSSHQDICWIPYGLGSSYRIISNTSASKLCCQTAYYDLGADDIPETSCNAHYDAGEPQTCTVTLSSSSGTSQASSSVLKSSSVAASSVAQSSAVLYSSQTQASSQATSSQVQVSSQATSSVVAVSSSSSFSLDTIAGLFTDGGSHAILCSSLQTQNSTYSSCRISQYGLASSACMFYSNVQGDYTGNACNNIGVTDFASCVAFTPCYKITLGLVKPLEINVSAVDSAYHLITDNVFPSLKDYLGKIDSRVYGLYDQVNGLHSHLQFVITDIDNQTNGLHTHLQGVQSKISALDSAKTIQIAALDAKITAMQSMLSNAFGLSSSSPFPVDCASNIYFLRVCSDATSFSDDREYQGCCNSPSSGSGSGSGSSSSGDDSADSSAGYLDCTKYPNDPACKSKGLLDQLISFFSTDSVGYSKADIDVKISTIENAGAASSGSGFDPGYSSVSAVMAAYMSSASGGAVPTFISHTFNDGWSLPGGYPKFDFVIMGNKYSLDLEQLQVSGKPVFEWLGLIFEASAIIGAIFIIFG